MPEPASAPDQARVTGIVEPMVALTASVATGAVAVGGVVSMRNVAEGAEAGPSPTPLLAVTVAVYGPSASPVIVQARGPVVQAQVWPPGDAVTV